MNTVRTLSIHEASFPIYGELAPGGGNIVACLRLQGALSPAQAEQGLNTLMQAEASLSVGCQRLQPQGQPQGYYFVQCTETAVPFEASTLEEGNLEAAIDKARTTLLNQPFQPGLRLWRSHLVSKGQQHCLLFCINHCVSDGSSVYYLLARWLKDLKREGVTGQTRAGHESAKHQALGQPLWHYMPKKLSGFFGGLRSLGILSTFIKAQKLADLGLSFSVGHNVPAMEHRCLSTHRCLPSPSFTALLRLTKENGQSIHGVISAALLNVLLSDCQKSGRLKNIKPTFSLPFVTTINARGKIIPAVDDSVAGCLSSGVTSMIEVKQSKIDNDYRRAPWHLGEQVVSGISQAFGEDQHWKILRIYQLAGLKGLKKMFLDSSEKPLATPISLANLGPVHFADAAHDIPPCHGLSVTGYEIYAAFHVSGAGVNIATSSLQGALSLCFTCPSPAVSQTTLEGYADEVVALLAHWSEHLGDARQATNETDDSTELRQTA